MAITSAFQADDAGSIPAVRSNVPLLKFMSEFPIFDKKTLIAHINTLLDPTRSDMKSTPDMSWIVAMSRDYLFQELLRTTKGNQAKAARMLGITRNTYALHLRRINRSEVTTDE